MWQPDYLESLAPLQGALSQLGATDRVSLAQDDVEEKDFFYAESLVEFVSVQLHLLNGVGFFALFDDLPTLAAVLKATVAPPHNQPRAGAAKTTQRYLAPILATLYRLAPRKVHTTLSHLRDLLEDWDGTRPVVYLARVYQDLEKVQPQNILNCLAELLALLEAQHRHLASCHPFAGVEQGGPSLLYQLQRVRENLWSFMDLSGACVLQEVLEELEKIQAVRPRSVGQED